MRPHRLRSLSLFEPIVFQLLPAGDLDLTVVNSVWEQIEGRWLAGDAIGAARSFVDYWSGAGAFGQLRETRQRALAEQVPKVLMELRTVADNVSDTHYRRIDVPTLLAAGLWSPEPAQRLTSMLADLLPHASCFEVPAGHLAPITHPALVNPIFERFIQSVDASDARLETEARPALAIPHFSELTAAVRGQGWLRAITFALSGVVLSVLPLFATQSIGERYFAVPPATTYPLEKSAWHEAPPGLAFEIEFPT
jgi:hypothetical protein